MDSVDNAEGSEKMYNEIEGTLTMLRSNIHDLLAVDDSSVDRVEKERPLLERTIENLSKDSINHLSLLKRLLNAPVPINRLPVELLSFIIRLSASPSRSNLYPYLPYTQVCHHWRSVLIHNAEFWTLIRPKKASFEFLGELIKRSKFAELDFIVTHVSPRSERLQDFFATESNRVRSLCFLGKRYLRGLKLENIHFPSLRKVILSTYERGWCGPSCGVGFTVLVPALTASDKLETLVCSLSEGVSMDQAVTVFSRIRRLVLNIESKTLLTVFLSHLHKFVKLQYLSLSFHRPGITDGNKDILVHLPKLQTLSTNIPSLMNQIQTSCLSDLYCVSTPRHRIDHRYSVFDGFDFSSIRYIHLRCPQARNYEDHSYNYSSGHCVLGSKERMTCRDVRPWGRITFFEEAIPDSRDCFHISFKSPRNPAGTNLPHLQAILTRILPLSTNLVELHALLSHRLYDIRSLLPMTPSLQKLVIKRGDKLLDFIKLLSDTSLCPELRELSYTTPKIPRNLEKYALDVGKKLTKCLQSRKENQVHQLKSISLRNCPPLSDHCLEELEELDTKVKTELDGSRRYQHSMTWSDEE